jgi:hypothetical protein
MPEGYPPARPYPGKVYRLRDAAEANQLVVVRCVRCRRSARYLATDLVTLMDPLRPAHDPPFDCSQCGTTANMKVGLHSPAAGDYGHLVVRRPGPVRHIQTWYSARLGDR